jgi:ABC-type antimicrobial peptide transport system permease subunit
MSETAFPINDLLRRKLQTALIIISLTLCVASTLFLLLFTEKLGFGILLMTEGKLTASFSLVFFQFITFIASLVCVVGAVIIAFLVFIMMVQRIRDIGLMKASGCPNGMIFGYFITELMIISFIGCSLGVIVGIVAYFVSSSLFSGFGLQISQGQVNLWLVFLVFGLFFALALVLGAKPVLDATKIEPTKALSPSHYFGVSKEGGFRAGKKSGLAMKIALRSLARHKSATFRIVICLAAVFLLTTVGIAGGIVANRTTESWIEKAVGRDTILIAHEDMCSQYRFLLSKFLEANTTAPFNYANNSYLMAEEMLNQLSLMPNISGIDPRLVLEADVKELQGYILGSGTPEITEVGDHRRGKSLVVGIYPEQVLTQWFLDGEFLQSDNAGEAVIGDSLAQAIFSMPLVQRIRLFDTDFSVLGVCIDPINNGNITYVPMTKLQNITGVFGFNIVIVRPSPSASRTDVMYQIREEIREINPEFDVLDLNEMLDESLGFINYVWSAIMFLPLFSLFAASLCLIAYVVLTINEQHQELGVLRALGAKPATIFKIVSWQSFIVMISSYAVGVAFGIMVTLMILIPDPVVTAYTVVEIAGWLLASLAATFAFGLYPAIKFAKKPVLEIMAQT